VQALKQACASIPVTSTAALQLVLEPLLTEKQAGPECGLSPVALARHRRAGTGPKFIVIGGSKIRYTPSAIQEWREARTFASTAEHYAVDQERAAFAEKQRLGAIRALKAREGQEV
jgi:predicted DNA-binding transcriptional regulator AlpA